MKTRKLKSLGLDEAIKVNTLAQAKYFIEKLGWNHLQPQQLAGKQITRNQEGFFNWGILPDGTPCISADKFIKPKKSKFKKLEKRVEALELLSKSKSKNIILKEETNYCHDYGKPISVIKINNEQKHDLKVGKWYKTDHAIVFYEGDADAKQGYPSFKGYGIFETIWIDKNSEPSFD